MFSPGVLRHIGLIHLEDVAADIQDVAADMTYSTLIHACDAPFCTCAQNAIIRGIAQ